MSSHLIDYFTNLVRITGASRSHTVNSADPTQVDTHLSYFRLDHGFETPEVGKHNGEVCEECGGTVADDRCFCTDYAYPLPNNYEVTITVPCWVTEVRIKARTGEEYWFVWDNASEWSRVRVKASGDEGEWSGSDAALADKMLDTFLSSADVIDQEAFSVDPCNSEPDYEMSCCI